MPDKPLTNCIVIVTRPHKESIELETKLHALGAKVEVFPTISVNENPAIHEQRNRLNEEHYDWVLFTSMNGVKYFFKAKEKIQTAHPSQKVKFATIGPRTTQELEKYGFHSSFSPSRYETRFLARELPVQKGDKILLPRADIAPDELKIILEERGAVCTQIPMYLTHYEENKEDQLQQILRQPGDKYGTFTSASTVHGFMKNCKDPETQARARDLRIISIGPVTTKVAQEYGFKEIYTADEATEAGLIKKLITLQTKI